MYIQLIKGRKWFWKVKDEDGQMVLVSQYFRTKWAAKRSARKLEKANGLQIRRPETFTRPKVNGIV
jgi:hypothetical protein